MSKPSDEGPATNSAFPGLLTQKEYARRRGCSKQYISQLVKQGRIQLVHGRIDPVAADAALAGMRDPSRGPKFRSDALGQATAGSAPHLGIDPAAGIQGTFAKARTVREHFRAMREKLEFEAATGELIRRQEIEGASYEIGVLFREHMTRAAEPIGALIADRFKVDYADAVDVVITGISRALQELADRIRDNEWGFDKGLPVEADSEANGSK